MLLLKAVGTDGWYRCSVTGYTTTNNYVRIALATDDNTTNWVGTNGENSIYIQNAQLESGMVSTDYLDSGATTAKAGVLIDLPRINYDANGENGALLLEPQRANLVQFSEYFDAWSKVNGGTGSNPVLDFGYTSPEGKDNAYKVTFDKGVGTTASDLSILQTSFTSGSNTASFYVKADAATRLMFRNSGTWAIYDIGTEWTRIEKTDTGGSLQIGLREGYGLSDVPDSCSVYLYGAQAESNASYPSSYIPNHGESGGVTRAADSCSVTGVSDVIGQTEGTLYVEFEYSNNSVGFVSIHSGNIGSRVYIGTDANGLVSQVRVGYVQQVFFSTSITIGTTYKCAIAYKENDFALYVNGSQIGTDTSGSVPSSMLKLGFDSGAGGDVLNQPTKKTMLFKERLSNAELAALTA
jgi:hypothetical protein